MHTLTDKGVLPDLKSLLALRSHANLLELKARKRVGYMRCGDHLSRFKGRGIDFDEVRVYDPHDDIRHIDWRVTARTGVPHTKLYREERERPVFLVVDLSTAMQFGTRVTFKSVMASHIAALLAWAALNQKDRIGGFIFSEYHHKEITPAGGRNGILRFLNHLADPAFAAWGQPGQQDNNNLLAAYLQKLRRVARPGSLIYVLSDFAVAEESWPELRRQYAQLAFHNEIMNIQLYDPIEKDLPYGTYHFSDGRQTMRVKLNSRQARERYQSMYDNRIALLEMLYKSYKVGHLAVATNDEPGKYFSTMLKVAQP